MKFTYYGHSCFAVEIKGKKILFDPFISQNELANDIDVNSIEADYIFISHGHFDHMDDAEAIAKRTGAKLVANWEVANWFEKKGVANYLPMNIGGKWAFDFGTVKCVTASHSSGLPDGSYGGHPIGFVITSDEGNFYYSGDTALTMDMQLIPAYSSLKFCVLPIGDVFTMDATDAVEAAKMVHCNTIIGVHYDTFGYIKIDKQKTIDLFSSAALLLKLPAIGETIEL
jgi:L-ascorbate metabolism protein UlaG (beta-lactamase superfamily)